LEPLRGGNGVFYLARHIRFKLAGRGPRQHGSDHDHRQIHIGKVLHFHGAKGQQTRKGQQHEQHDSRNRVADGPGREVHANAPYLLAACAGAISAGALFCSKFSVRLTRSPSLRKAPPRATTRALGSRPEEISTRSPTRCPICTRRSATWWSAPTSKTCWKPSRSTRADCGTVSAERSPSRNSPSANMPARRSACAGRST